MPTRLPTRRHSRRLPPPLLQTGPPPALQLAMRQLEVRGRAAVQGCGPGGLHAGAAAALLAPSITHWLRM